MNLDVLVSTMHDEINIYDKMNIQGSAVIVNQTDYEDEQILLTKNNERLKFINSKDRGLSKSRNLAINNSESDICIFADNDVIYEDNYIDTILEAYKKHPDAAVIAFTVSSTNMDRPSSRLRTGRINRIMSMKISSVQISFKRSIIEEYQLYLNENFGAGSNTFSNGEENIFLYNAIKKGLKVYYVDQKIAEVNHDESTWYGKNPEKDLLTKGAMFYTMSSILYPLYNIQFGIRKYKEYNESFTFLEALKILFRGSRKGRVLLKNSN